MQTRRGILRPAVLHHIFPVEFGASRFQIREIIALYFFGIDPIIRRIVAEHRLRADALERVLQIEHQLAEIRYVLGVIRILGKENRAYLLCGHTRSVAIHQNRQNLLGSGSFERQDVALVQHLKIAEAFDRQQLFYRYHVFDMIDLSAPPPR